MAKRYFRCDYSQYQSKPCWDAVCIPLTKGRHSIIDADDFENMGAKLWAVRGGYAGNHAGVQMHRLIMNPDDAMLIDHINHDELDNRKANLRIVTHTQNMWNSRKSTAGKNNYKGVCWHKAANKWRARLRVNYEVVYIGFFHDEIEAAKAYKEAAEKHLGEFAYSNFTG